MDVFISYEHESKSIADNICSVLESRGVRCWYAPRDVYGDYATSIVEAIEKCKVFVLILNHNSSESPHVLNEVEMAYKRILNGEITIIPFKVDEGILSKAMEYYVKRLHWIDAVSEPLEKSIHHLYEQLVPILGIEKSENKSKARLTSTISLTTRLSLRESKRKKRCYMVMKSPITTNSFLVRKTWRFWILTFYPRNLRCENLSASR